MGKEGDTHSGNVGHTHSQSNSRILGSKEVEGGGDGDDGTHGVMRRRKGKERGERERDHLWRSPQRQLESTSTACEGNAHSTATACSTT